MKMSLSSADELLVQRHVDGELAPAAAAAFAARLAAEPVLRQRVESLQALRTGFLAGRERGPRPGADFAGKVMAAVRQLPSRQQLEQAGAAGGAAMFCRRLLLAAALLAGLGLAWGLGLCDGGAPQELHATPDEMQRELDRLDGILLGGGVDSGAPGSSAPARKPEVR
jgi:anti-sigma factor RsiW